MDPRVTRLADTLVNYSLAVQPGEWVVLRANIAAMPLVNESLRHILKAGGHYTLILENEALEELLLREGSDDQIRWISPVQTVAYEQMDAYLYIRAAENTRYLAGTDPQKQTAYYQALQVLTEIRRRREAEGKMRWTLTEFPCAAYAQEANMSLVDYEDFVYAATYADQSDPVKHWQAVHDRQATLVAWLEGKEQVEIRGPHADLALSIKGRKFINSSGKANMPSGEIFTSPVEDSANGWIRFSYPAIRYGREVEGVELTFENGRVVKASAKKEEPYLLSQLDSDEGAHFLGELGIGTNFNIQRFTKSILYDEKIGGTIHLALGFGFHEAGGKNNSNIHWDFICDMRNDSEILVDGELFYKNGKFKV